MDDLISREAVKEALRNRIGESISDCINSIPASVSLDNITKEIEEFAKNPNFGDLSLGASCGAMRALEIINKHRNGGVV